MASDATLASLLALVRAANQKKEQAEAEAFELDLKYTPKTVSSEQMARVEQAIQQQRIEREKGGWRASARWLAENFPKDFGEPEAVSGAELQPVSRATVEPQCPSMVPESPQSAPAALPPVSSIPLLESAFWQKVLHGSRDALLSPMDANIALRLVAHELSTHCSGADFIETVRAGVLRKALSERFGAKVWDVMNKLWRAAPASPGAPQPNEDQSRLTPGVRDCPRSMPAWRREFHQEINNEQRLLESMGAGPGGF